MGVLKAALELVADSLKLVRDMARASVFLRTLGPFFGVAALLMPIVPVVAPHMPDIHIASGSAAPATPEAPDYMGTYGGLPKVYARISQSSDCDNLQSEFDLAYDHHKYARNNAQTQWTTGYMTAAYDRENAIGCHG